MVFALWHSLETGRILLTALNIAALAAGFSFLAPFLTEDRYATSPPQFVGNLLGPLYVAAAVPAVVIVLRSPYDPAVLYWPALGAALGWGISSAVFRMHRRRFAGERELRSAIAVSVQRVTPDFSASDFPAEAAAAGEETERRRAAVFDRWSQVDLPLSRKVMLARHGIVPERALDPEVASMDEEDLRTLSSMRRMAGDLVSGEGGDPQEPKPVRFYPRRGH